MGKEKTLISEIESQYNEIGKKQKKKARKRIMRRRRRRKFRVYLLRFLSKLIPILILFGICAATIYFTKDFYYIDGKYDINNAATFAGIPCIIFLAIGFYVIHKWFKFLRENEAW